MPTIDPEAYARDGYQVLPHRLEEKDVRRAVEFFDDLDRREVDPAYQPEFDADGTARRLRKVRRLLWNDPHLWGPMLNRAGVGELAHQIIGESAAVVFHAAFLKPAKIGTPVALHQDQALWSYDYPSAFSVWFALTEVNPDNGGLFGSPGSHSWGTIEHRDRSEYRWHLSLDAIEDHLPEPFQFDLTPGDAVIWDRNFAHGSSANTSLQDRRGMVVAFADASASGFGARDYFGLADLLALGTD